MKNAFFLLNCSFGSQKTTLDISRKMDPLRSLLLVILMGCTLQATSQSIDWQLDYSAGQYDAQGNYLSGTEIMRLVPHKGRLFANTSTWMETDSFTTPQILVLDSADGEWRLDANFPESYNRVAFMTSLVFDKDSLGNTIPSDTLLFASPNGLNGAATIYIRDDQTNTWDSIPFANSQAPGNANIRSINTHYDQVTGGQVLFVGSATGVYSGFYDANYPGNIRWSLQAKFTPPTGERVMGFATCNDTLYCATTSTLFRRTDGPQATWDTVLTQNCGGAGTGVRGLTTIDNPDGPGEALLLCCNGVMARVVPSNNYEVVPERDLVEALSEALGRDMKFVLATYNSPVPYLQHPGYSDPVHVIGLEATYEPYEMVIPPIPETIDRWDIRGFYFVRNQLNYTVTYDFHEVTRTQPDTLLSVRTFCVSPFPQDNGQVFYAGGFDCNSIPVSNTAWIYKGTFEDPTLGINEPVDLNHLVRIYPNPTQSNVMIKFDETVNLSDIKIEVYTLTGKLLISKKPKYFRQHYDLDRYPSGTYLIKILQNENLVTKKIIKN